MKNERVELRASHQERKLLEKAASSLGMNLSTFIRMAARERASEILRSNTTIMLTERDADLFLNALENPPKPNTNLKKAFSKYQRTASRNRRRNPA